VPLNDSALEMLAELDTDGEFEHLFVNRQAGKPYTTIMPFVASVGLSSTLNRTSRDSSMMFGRQLARSLNLAARQNRTQGAATHTAAPQSAQRGRSRCLAGQSAHRRDPDAGQ